jgi:hypothetical protein
MVKGQKWWQILNIFGVFNLKDKLWCKIWAQNWVKRVRFFRKLEKSVDKIHFFVHNNNKELNKRGSVQLWRKLG